MFANSPFRILRILFRARRPSRLSDMVAVSDAFWLRKGFEALTFFGTILTHSQEEADAINTNPSGVVGDVRFATLKNHEMIHLRQAQSTRDSWLCFYLLYIRYWLQALPANRKVPHGAYLINPFEMEAYAHMHDLAYLDRCPEGATEWRRYARMTLRERLRLYQR